MDSFQVTERWHDRCVVVAVAGELDLATVDEVTRVLSGVEARYPFRVVIDLSAVTFMGSTGLNLLVCAHNRLGRDRLRIVTQHPFTLRLLRVTGLDRVLVVLPVVEDAMSV